MDNKRIGLTQALSGSELRIWAPSLERCTVRFYKNSRSTESYNSILMKRDENDYFFHSFDQITERIFYDLELQSGLCIPDPFADENIDGVHGRSISQLQHPGTQEKHSPDWRGIPVSNAVMMEIHVGTFTEMGTYKGCCEKLDYLAERGITVIQLMPILLTPGARNWGYDPVSFFTLNPNYGSAQELQTFIETAHSKGIAVVLDVVFNHLGPEGNYFSLISKGVFDRKERTPWGNSINLSSDSGGPVRDLILQSVEKWMSLFGFDGIRVDAGEYLRPAGDLQFLMNIAAVARASCAHENPLLVLEHDLYRLNERDRETLFSDQGYNLLWNCAILGSANLEDKGCTEKSEALASIICPLISKRTLGSNWKDASFVNFLRSHDTIGNSGDLYRNQKIDRRLWIDLLPVLLLNPSVPMVFMGDEWMSDTPFHFFCDLDDTCEMDLINARVHEFGREELRNTRPMSEEAFLKSKLNWAQKNTIENETLCEYFSKLVDLRKEYFSLLIESGLDDIEHWRSDSGAYEAIKWHSNYVGSVTLMCIDRPVKGEVHPNFGEMVFSSADFYDQARDGFSSRLFVEKLKTLKAS